MYLQGWTNLLFFSVIGYLVVTLWLSIDEDVRYGDQRRQIPFSQAILPPDILSDFEFFFIRSRDPPLPINSDTGSSITYDAETESKQSIQVSFTPKAVSADRYAGTNYVPPPNAQSALPNVSSGCGYHLFSQSFRKANVPPKAVIFYIHGFGDHTSWYTRDQAVMFAQNNYAFHALDCRGSGRSDGMQLYYPSFESLVDDYVTVYREIKQRYPPNTPCFFLGVSMGGCIALNVAWKDPTLAKGAVLLAPMVKVKDDVQPPEIVISILTALARIIPTAPITPTPDMGAMCFKDQSMYEQRQRDPIRIQIKPRLLTALNVRNAALHMTANIRNVTIPFLVLHGNKDTVTDPVISEALYKEAASKDKKYVSIEGAYHDLLAYDGFKSEGTQRTLKEIFKWLDERCK